MNVDSISAHGSVTSTRLEVLSSHCLFFFRTENQSNEVVRQSWAHLLLLSLNPGMEGGKKEAQKNGDHSISNPQGFLISERERERENISRTRCPYFLVCATVFIPLIPPSLVYFFFPLSTGVFLFVSYLSYTERTKINGSKNRIDENATFLRSFLFFFLFFSLPSLVILIECPREGVMLPASSLFSPSQLVVENIMNAYYYLPLSNGRQAGSICRSGT